MQTLWKGRLEIRHFRYQKRAVVVMHALRFEGYAGAFTLRKSFVELGHWHRDEWPSAITSENSMRLVFCTRWVVKR